MTAQRPFERVSRQKLASDSIYSAICATLNADSPKTRLRTTIECQHVRAGDCFAYDFFVGCPFPFGQTRHVVKNTIRFKDVLARQLRIRSEPSHSDSAGSLCDGVVH